MQFELTEEQAMIQETARRFAAEEIAPTLEAEERKHEFKQERVAKMGELGFFTCALPEEFGGLVLGKEAMFYTTGAGAVKFAE